MVESERSDRIVTAAFGQKNRQRLLSAYFAEPRGAATTPENAWAHVYRLLLWTDQTTGLAHCYESDKSQPGKAWYARSLAFHDWLAAALDVSPAGVAEAIDWLFERAASELAADVVRKASSLSVTAERQRQPYDGKGFPEPGEDPELVAIVRQVLGDHLASDPSVEVWRLLVQRIRQYLMLDNKRKNLLGEGFEDVLGALLQRSCPPQVEVHTRRLLHDLPGFNRARRGEKPNKVDVAVLRPSMRTLVTAKWSVRADREKQFVVDFGDYATAESDGKAFEYVFVTNEFDPARLMRACEKLAVNAAMFTHVVHISTDALRATYGNAQEDSMKKVLGFIDSGRLISLQSWLDMLST
jgi:hypothetical protein